jgi:hypothetical protein
MSCGALEQRVLEILLIGVGEIAFVLRLGNPLFCEVLSIGQRNKSREVRSNRNRSNVERWEMSSRDATAMRCDDDDVKGRQPFGKRKDVDEVGARKKGVGVDD